MPLPRVTNTLRRAALQPAAFSRQLVRCLSATTPRRAIMADGTRPADDIDLAFDYPSDVQATYTLPAGFHHARLDKEMGYPDQRVLYALVAGLGTLGLYGAIKGNSTGSSSTDSYMPAAPKEMSHRAQEMASDKFSPVVSKRPFSSSSSKSTDHVEAANAYDAQAVAGGEEFGIPKTMKGKKVDGAVHVADADTERVVHLPNRKPTDSKMERFLGRGG